MKLAVIFVLILIKYGESNVFECGHSDDHFKFIELYYTNYDGSVPINCSMTFQCIAYDKSKVTQLKLGGSNSVKEQIEDYPNLKTLDLSHSGIESLDSFDLHHEYLKHINLSHNLLEQIPISFFFKLTRVIEVDLSYNKIIEINDFPVKLESINLSHNEILYLNPYDFEELSELTYLDLSYNLIANFAYDNSILSYNNKLRILRLTGNPIKEFDYRLSQLVQRGVSVYVSWSFITELRMWNDKTGMVRAILNGDQEGVLHTKTGRVEFHCGEMSFKRIFRMEIKGNEVENPNSLLQCLSSSLEYLELSEILKGTLDLNLLKRFTNLVNLSLRGVKMGRFDFVMLQNHPNLTFLDISDNNLRTIDNIPLLNGFKNLISVDVEDNQFEIAPELIKHLSPKITNLNLAGNFLGNLNETTFAHLININRLVLRNTSLSLENFRPFELFDKLLELDLSYNNLENVDFTVASMTLYNLKRFYAAYCNIKSSSELIKLLGTTIRFLDISGNALGEWNAKMFEKLTELRYINLSNCSLRYIDTNVFARHPELNTIDISFNFLKTVDFASVSNELHSLYVEGNDLTEMDNFTKLRFPSVQRLDISKNQFTCEYLAIFVPRIMHEWPGVRIFNDPWEQKNNETC